MSYLLCIWCALGFYPLSSRLGRIGQETVDSIDFIAKLDHLFSGVEMFREII